MTTFVARLRARRLARLVDGERPWYEQESSLEIARWQLAAFNVEWRRVQDCVPYYQRLAADHRLPRAFESWEQFSASVPALTRETLQRQAGSFAHVRGPRHTWRATSGSTGRPLRLPVWRSEALVAARDAWLGRSWWGVTPSDRAFLLWGHSHALPRGLRGWFARHARAAADRLLGYHRFSAYDLSDSQLERAAEALAGERPSWMMGYSVALDRFAKVNASRRAAFHDVRLKVAIATAESFPRPESRAGLSEVLGCPVAMEYGAVETGPIAHERPGGRLQVFWRHFFVEGEPSAQVAGAAELLVTTLYPRCVPLIRYRIGDLVVGDSHTGGFSHEQIEAVLGRCNDYVVLEDGSIIHSEAFAHAVRCVPVLNYQLVRVPGSVPTLRCVTERALATNELRELRARLKRVHPLLVETAIESVAALETTSTGKTPRLANVRV